MLDAKDRKRFFSADNDKDLANAILEVKKELDQFDDLLNGDSVLFRNSIWKVQLCVVNGLSTHSFSLLPLLFIYGTEIDSNSSVDAFTNLTCGQILNRFFLPFIFLIGSFQ